MLGEWYNAGCRIKRILGENPEIPFYSVDPEKGVKQTALLSVIGNPNYLKKLPKEIDISILSLEEATLSKNQELKQIHVPFYMPTFDNLVHEKLKYKREYALPLAITISYFVKDKVILITPTDGPDSLFKEIYEIIRKAVSTVDGIKEFYPTGYEYQALFELLFNIYDKYEIKLNIIEKKIKEKEEEIEKRKRKVKKNVQNSEKEKLKKLFEVLKGLSEEIEKYEKEKEKMKFYKFFVMRVKSGSKKIFENMMLITLNVDFINFIKEFIKEYKNNDLLKDNTISDVIIWSIWEGVTKSQNLYEEYNMILRNFFFRNILHKTNPHYKNLIIGVSSNFSNILSNKYALSNFQSKIGIEFLYLITKVYLRVMMTSEYSLFKQLFEIGVRLGEKAKKEKDKGLFYELKLARNKEEFIKKLSTALYQYDIELDNEEYILNATLDQLQAYILLGFAKGWTMFKRQS